MPNPDVPRPPKLPTRKPPARVAADGSGLLDGDSYHAELYERASLRDRDLRHTSFSECAFAGADLTGANLGGAHLVESELVEVEAAALSAPRSLWRHSLLARSRLGAIEAYEATFDGLQLSEVKISYLNARAATWKDVLLQRCVIDELDLVGAELNRVRFEDCQITSLELSTATCRDVDLRSAEIRQVSGLAGLRGCTITPEQLYDLSGALATHLGIDVAGPMG